MRRLLPVAVLAVAALSIPFAPATAKGAPTATYNGKATSTDGTTKYGAASFTIKNGKLVAWSANEVPRQCQDLELMNYGFTVAPNVLKAYGLKTQDVAKIREALQQVLTLMKVTETPAEIGYWQSIEAEWFYALGPRFRTRALAVLREVNDLARSRDPLQYLTRLQQLVPEVAWLETKAKTQSEGGEKHGPFTLYVMPGVTRKDIVEAKAALDQATTLIHRHFPKVLYGGCSSPPPSPRVSPSTFPARTCSTWE